MKRTKTMMALILSFLLLISVGMLAACGEKEDFIKEFSVPQNLEGIYGTDFTIPTVIATDKNGVKITASVVVKDADGKKVEFVGSTFFLDKLSDYTLTYTVSYKEKEKELTISKDAILKVIDNVAPVISAGQEWYFYLLGSEITLPKIEVIDEMGDTITPTTKLVYLGATEEEITVTDNKFTATKKGIYELRISAEDASENKASKVVKFEIAQDENKAVYLDYQSGISLVTANENCLKSFSADRKVTGDNGSLNIKSTGYLADTDGSVWMNVKIAESQIADITNYNYFYYYVYNNSNDNLVLNQNNKFGKNVNLTPMAWTKVIFAKADFASVLGDGVKNFNNYQLILNIKGITDVDLYFSSIKVTNELNKVDFSSIKSSYLLNQTVDFSEIVATNATGTYAVEEIKLFGESELTLTNKTYTFNKLGSYTLQVTFADEGGIVIKDNKTIVIKDEELILDFNSENIASRVQNGGNTTVTANTEYPVLTTGGTSAIVSPTITTQFTHAIKYTFEKPIDLTKYSAITFYVWQYDYENGVLLRVYNNNNWETVTIPDYTILQSAKVNAATQSEWNKVVIPSSEFANLFTDPTKATDFTFHLANGGSGNRAFISGVYGVIGETTDTLDTSSLKTSYAVNEEIDLSQIKMKNNATALTLLSCNLVKGSSIMETASNKFTFADSGDYYIRVSYIDSYGLVRYAYSDEFHVKGYVTTPMMTLDGTNFTTFVKDGGNCSLTANTAYPVYTPGSTSIIASATKSAQATFVVKYDFGKEVDLTTYDSISFTYGSTILKTA